ncbi:MAG: hypothetical protein LBR19_05170 [Bifidobacteriaceae bacterium]|jgi:uncharacterized protein YukE|nr:hypothetical protein [Bifidobacteriaceae bacterium]
MTFSGITDVDAAKKAVEQMRAKARDLDAVKQQLGSVVSKLDNAWVGGDAHNFLAAD